MKRSLFMALLSSLIFSAVSPAVYAEETPTQNVIIVYKDDIDYKTVEDLNGEIDDVLKHVPVVTGEVPVAAIDVLENDKDILAVEVDQKVKINAQIQDWGIQSVNAPASWESQLTGKGMKIAVLDTGISPHEDLMISGGVSFTSYTSSYNDDNGHGTHVAGIIGAKNNSIGTIGVAPESNLFAVKVLDQNGSGYISDIIKGIDWSITNKMDVINLSLGAPNDSIALHQAVDKAYNSGVLVVAAAGNDGASDGSGDTVDYPARYNSVIAVSATDSSNQRGSFSSTGHTVEVAAPGVKVNSTYLNNQYISMSGTSMATPYVAGILALLKQRNPALTAAQLREKLIETTIDIGPEGKDTFFGYGLVQAPIQPQDSKTETFPPVVTPATTEKLNKPAQPIQVKQPVNTNPKKIVKKNLTTSVSTTASTYKAGKAIWINVKIIDKGSKKPIANGSIKLRITPPKGKVKVVTLKSNKKGQASYKMTTSKSTNKGTYTFSTTTSISNYHIGYASKKIRIK